MENKDDVLSRKEAAKYLGICLTTLDRLDIPRLRIRHRVLYKRQAVIKWLDGQIENSKGAAK